MPAVSQPIAKKKKTPGWWLRLAGWIFGGMLAFSVALSLTVRGLARSYGGEDGLQVRVKIKMLGGMLATHRLLFQAYPTQEQGLEAIIQTKSTGQDSERAADRLKDPWHRKLQYRIPGIHHPDSYDLFSLGPDGIEGTEDDITNW